MPRTLRRSAQRLLHLVVITSLVLTAIGPISPPRSLAAPPERAYAVPAFDLRAELAKLPAGVRRELAAAGASLEATEEQPADLSPAPALGIPPEPGSEAADLDVVPAILQATVDPPMAKAGELVTVTVVVSAEGDLPAATLASDLPDGVTFASTLGERTVFLAADREPRLSACSRPARRASRLRGVARSAPPTAASSWSSRREPRTSP